MLSVSICMHSIYVERAMVLLRLVPHRFTWRTQVLGAQSSDTSVTRILSQLAKAPLAAP